MSLTTLTKDPDAVLDYRFDWSPWLADGETIVAHTITAQTGITLASSSEASGVVTGWVSGGTVGTIYTLACRITTSAGRIDERTMSLSVRER